MTKNQQEVMNWVVGYVAEPTPGLTIEDLGDWHFEILKSMVSMQAQVLGMSREEIMRGMISNGFETGYFTCAI